MVLRMQPDESMVESSGLREFQCINAFHEHVPILAAYWVDDEREYLPYPALSDSLVGGVSKPASRVSGMGTNYGAPLSSFLSPKFVVYLAHIHIHKGQAADLYRDL